MSNFITTATLNLRKNPQIESGNVLTIMPPDTVVAEISDTVKAGFRQVKLILSNEPIEGFASQQYLKPTDLALPEVEPPLTVPAVHYPAEHRIISLKGTGRVYPLNENGLVKIDLKSLTETAERKKGIHDVINYLDVEKSARYAPNSVNTFCNVYAYDVAYCLGAYLPRVWWTADAIVKWQKDKNVTIQYDKTVTELTANRLCDWYDKFGSGFGWRRLFDLTAFQDEANKGQLGILVAQRINMNNPGHIVAVVPEAETIGAKRNNANIVLAPLQSQAGRINRKFVAANAWWEDKTRFKKFAFWIWKLT